MSVSELLTRACTITRRGASGDADEYGDEILDETTEETVCEVQQRQRSEPAGQGELSDTGWLGVFLPGTALRTGDKVEVDGLGELELVGDPWPVRDPETGAESHVEADLRQTIGSEEGP